NEIGTTRLKLEGKLAQEWVGETEKAWEALSAMNQGIDLVIDLFSVTFVDDDGRQLLARMRHAGAELAGHGPLMAALIEEIEDIEMARATDGAEEEVEQ
ncbi:MAG TPA: hypothetical protein VGF08_06830, partial [Terriglobales bacterium]